MSGRGAYLDGLLALQTEGFVQRILGAAGDILDLVGHGRDRLWASSIVKLCRVAPL